MDIKNRVALDKLLLIDFSDVSLSTIKSKWIGVIASRKVNFNY